MKINLKKDISFIAPKLVRYNYQYYCALNCFVIANVPQLLQFNRLMIIRYGMQAKCRGIETNSDNCRFIKEKSIMHFSINIR